MNFTDKQSLLLSQLAYMNLSKTTDDAMIDYDNKSLKNIAKELIKIHDAGVATVYDSIQEAAGSGGISSAQYVEILNKIIQDKTLGNLVLTDYVDNNKKTGFVAYAFKDLVNNESVFAFRGSDDGGMNKSIDWPDNFGIGINLDSIQTVEVQKFVGDNLAKNGSSKSFVTGHSKGSANAMYAAATFENCTGKGFDGPGIGYTLSTGQKVRLFNSNFVNYVGENDLVGAAMDHPEKRVFVNQLESHERFK